MKIARKFTKPSVHPFDEIAWEKRTSVIMGRDGAVVFEIRDAEVPKNWSQLASDIVTSKYFRKAGLAGPEGRETSVKQVVSRVAKTLRQAGEAQKCFSAASEAEAFEAELTYILVNQLGAFNSPVWFNCGLYHQYGIVGSGGNWHWEDAAGQAVELKNNYEHPQCSACFIQSIEDSLSSIFDLLKNESRIFKYGSGTGTNFSALRSKWETLSGGGTSSGLMSFLEVFDRAAGATKSGGTTRRAAKMVCLDVDHPEILDFISWKSREERKAHALIREGYPADFNGEAYHTISGQNSNNSVRLPDEFMLRALNGGEWQTRERTTGKPGATYEASDLFDQICEAAWECADPGLQFDTTINEWHTTPRSGRINASNPCSEFMFLDDSACNLASINLVKFLRDDGLFDIEAFRHVVEILFLAQEIAVDFSSYPVKKIAENSHRYRPLGLGYANLGALLMQLGIPYDSAEGASLCAALTAMTTGYAYAMSAKIAAESKPFEAFAENREAMLRVIRKHRDAAYAISEEHCRARLLAAARQAWDEALILGEKHGYRNAQATALAPTGTIGLLMDCDTTGIEPDFALVKFKKLAGGGHFKIVNASAPEALRRLGYPEGQIEEIVQYAIGLGSFAGAPYIHRESLLERGLTEDEADRAENALRGAFDLASAFSAGVVGRDAYTRLDLEPSASSGADLLDRLGFSAEEIEDADLAICGRMTVEGAPHLKDEHLPVFDCANPCGRTGKRFIEPMAHLRMMAAAQPFISGAISKTVNLPRETTVEEIHEIYAEGWRMGLKAVALYRDGCKASQPLTSKADPTAKTEQPKEKEAEEREALLVSVAAAEAPHLQEAPALAELAEYRPLRRRLPQRRSGFTQEAKVGGHKVFLRTGEYEDGALGEIFIDMHKAGAALRSMMNCFAIAVSKGLQYGVPLDEYVDTFIFTRFEPQGVVDHPYIKMSTSVIDYVFRVLGLEYLGRTDFCQVKPEERKAVEQRVVDAALDIMDKEAARAPEQPSSQAKRDGNGKGGPRAKQLDGADSVLDDGIVGPSSGRSAPKRTAHGGGKAVAVQTQVSLDRHLAKMMGDAPFCENCGHVTVRNGACYRCENCGHSMGCS